MPDPSAPSSIGTGQVPVATITPQGQTLRIAHVNQAAYETGIRAGQTVAEARAVLPNIVTHDDDPAADRCQLESLAVWANCLSPVVHIEGEDTLIADVTGCQRLFDGESNLLDRAIDGLETQGFSVRGAVADTPGAAWALAHAHPESALIAQPGQTAAHVGPLPVWALRIAPRTQAALASVGVDTIASLLYLPRSSLVSRFGQTLLDRIDQALGDLPEVLTPYRPQPALTSRFCIGAPTTRLDVLTVGVHQALIRFCKKLDKQAAGVRQLFVTFYCPDVVTEDGLQTRTVTFPVDLSQPTRRVDHLHPLLIVLLNNLHLPAPADSLMLWARRLEPLDGWQDELFTTDAADARELGNLLDRLVVRLGSGAVVLPRLLSEHQPERAFRYVPVAGFEGIPSKRAAGFSPRGVAMTVNATSFCKQLHRLKPADQAMGLENPRGLKPAAQVQRDDVAGVRPLRLASPPVKIAATALVPEGPPISFHLRGTRHAIAHSVGPERIETGWWRGPHVQRDYYRVTTEQGRRCWLFRDRNCGRWFLHGWFD